MVVTLIAISLLGLALLCGIALTSHAPTQYPDQNVLVFGVLAAIDLLGILAAVSPTGCARSINPVFRRGFAQEDWNDQPRRGYEGHHPPCGEFGSHVITISGKKYCAGCTGLVLGAVLSLLGIAFFFGYPGPLPSATLFWLGFSLVFISQLQPLLVSSGFARLLFSFCLAFGSLLLLLGVNGLASNLFLDCYCLSLMVFMIIARTAISRRTHASICSSCGLGSCPLSE